MQTDAGCDAILSRGGRHLFLAPWRGRTLIGVWHGVYQGAPDEVASRRRSSRRSSTRRTRRTGLSLSRKDVTMVNFGLILFEDKGRGGRILSENDLLIDHADATIDGLVHF